MRFLILIFVFTLFSCVDEVSLDLKPNVEYIAVDASINWFKGTDGSSQKIIITKSQDYYTQEKFPVLGAEVSIKDESGNLFLFNDIDDSGVYVCDNFIPALDKKYMLAILYDGETYTAENTLLESPDIIEITQKEDGGIFGQELEIKPFFQDDGQQENYYMFRYRDSSGNLPEYQILTDKFFNGNKMFGIYTAPTEENQNNQDEYIAKKGDTIKIWLFGINKRNYDFLNILFDQTGNGGSGNPFSTIPVNAKGNIINQTNSDKIAYGYFRLSQVTSVDYIIE
ncbi:MAG: DUF4249 domain-containing protein [Flavobacteriales bacterium]|nr:DUF4249 domain-containing protein [Flavobacteriales bacterium]